MKRILLFVVIIVFNLSCSQIEDSKKDKQRFIGKTFKANIGGMCAETIPFDPCAGYTSFLYITFKEKDAEVSEQNISCEKVIGKQELKSNWTAKGNSINVEKLIRYGQPFKIDTLRYKENKLFGSEVNGENVLTEYVFEEIKK